jgi:hypothetical protein
MGGLSRLGAELAEQFPRALEQRKAVRADRQPFRQVATVHRAAGGLWWLPSPYYPFRTDLDGFAGFLAVSMLLVISPAENRDGQALAKISSPRCRATR